MAVYLHSPLEIEVLLHHYYSPRNWTAENPDSKEAGEATDYWLAEGCLMEDDDTGRESGFRLTPRGTQMVEGWRAGGTWRFRGAPLRLCHLPRRW